MTEKITISDAIPAAVVGLGFVSLGCAGTLYIRAINANYKEGNDKSSSKGFWYAAGALFVGTVLVLTGAVALNKE